MITVSAEGQEETSSVTDVPDEDSVKGIEAEEKELLKEDEDNIDPEMPDVERDEKESFDVDMKEVARSEVLRQDADILSVQTPTLSLEHKLGALSSLLSFITHAVLLSLYILGVIAIS